MTTTVTAFDIADYLNNDEEMAGYLSAVLEEGGVELFLAALGDVARAKGISQLSSETGLTRNGIYRAFAQDGNPTINTVEKLLTSLGMRISVAPAR
jgi:probable addiction module antidote protein